MELNTILTTYLPLYIVPAFAGWGIVFWWGRDQINVQFGDFLFLIAPFIVWAGLTTMSPYPDHLLPFPVESLLLGLLVPAYFWGRIRMSTEFDQTLLSPVLVLDIMFTAAIMWWLL